MYDIYATVMEFEQCAADKEHIQLIVPYAVIHYIISGYGYVGGKKIAKGSAFIASANSYMDYYPDKEQPWSYVYIRLFGEDVKKAFEDAGFPQGIHIVPFEKQEAVQNLLSLYQAIGASECQHGKKLIANALFMLHIEKIDSAAALSVREQNVERIKKYIDDNYFKEITVSDISKAFYLSCKYIRNLFVHFLGISPKQYIQSKRMQRAKELLLETDESIALIAHSVGYNDALLFSKMFSKYYALSPKKYRLENRQRGQPNAELTCVDDIPKCKDL